jgi:hypothetical protein
MFQNLQKFSLKKIYIRKKEEEETKHLFSKYCFRTKEKTSEPMSHDQVTDQFLRPFTICFEYIFTIWFHYMAKKPSTDV